MYLIAGATGYIGGLLAEELASAGREARCMARAPERARGTLPDRCEVVRGDVLEPDTLDEALAGVELAYYLVHSMGRGGDSGFAERDRRGARNFAQACERQGVERLVYLGGLGEGKSEHLRSRQETAEELASTGIPLTYFRAAIVIGAGSESLRTIAYLVKRLPAMITPSWTDTRTQPIAAADVTAYLAAAPDVPGSSGREIEIGGPDVTTYGELLDLAAEARGSRRRPRLGVPLLSPSLSSHWIGLVTPVDAGVARPLVEGLATETIVEDDSGMALFDVERTALRDAMAEAVPAALRS
ncbi:MAG: NAD(P)H-binding protein [Solirubrobacterales bacterium]|nr:NAD(P)H-binding protein [Solirubrobacterales bacterium]MCB8969402.1 NAD(P)H-binding protein [Thermoleophilales bacterium]